LSEWSATASSKEEEKTLNKILDVTESTEKWFQNALFPNSLYFNHTYPVSLDFPKKIIQ